MCEQRGISSQNFLESPDARSSTLHFADCSHVLLLESDPTTAPVRQRVSTAAVFVFGDEGKPKSSTIASCTACPTNASIDRAVSAASMSPSRALVNGLRGVNSVQQS